MTDNFYQEMTDREFLIWLRDRLVHVYGERPNIDFVKRLLGVADHVQILKEELDDLYYQQQMNV